MQLKVIAPLPIGGVFTYNEKVYAADIVATDRYMQHEVKHCRNIQNYTNKW